MGVWLERRIEGDLLKEKPTRLAKIGNQGGEALRPCKGIEKPLNLKMLWKRIPRIPSRIVDREGRGLKMP